MADLYTILQDMRNNGYFRDIARNPLAQFGSGARAYLGPTLLPERIVPENLYRETAIKYRTVIANAGTRYSPTQLKKGDLIGEFLVELAESDIRREFTSRDYDALLMKLKNNLSMEAMVQLIDWVDRTVNLALVELNELQRWDALINASVVLKGDNEYTQTINYSNPAGHRFNATGVWSNNAFDPMIDIIAGAELLASKGYTVSRIVTARPVMSKLSLNNNIRTRTGVATISPTGQITATGGRATMDAINGMLERDALPRMELYDLQYRTQVATGYFFARNAFAMFATTGQSETLDQGDAERILENTLGYHAVGRPAGQNDPGRVIRAQAFEDKPPRVVAEGWQTSLPVITEPEAIVVIGGIS